MAEESKGIKCPVCGKYTFAEEDDYDICDECWWMNDRYQNMHPEYAGGANKMSLNQARAAYARGGKVR